MIAFVKFNYLDLISHSLADASLKYGFHWPSGGWNDLFLNLPAMQHQVTELTGPLPLASTSPLLPWIHPLISRNEKYELERRVRDWEKGSKVGKDGRREVMRKKIPGLMEKGFKNIICNLLSVTLSFVKTCIHPSQIRTELKSNLLCRLFLDVFWSAGFTSGLHSPLLMLKEEWENNSII